MPARIACVQSGNYWTTRNRLREGGAETYGYQRYTMQAFERLVEGLPHLVVSLDGETPLTSEGNGQFVSVSQLRVPGVPTRFLHWWRARNAIQHLERFAPSHLLVRYGDIIGGQVLAWAARRGVAVGVLIAQRFDPGHPPARRFCALANRANVAWVGNHNRVATESLVACGLRPEKALAWDYPVVRTPAERPPRVDPQGRGVLFAGQVVTSKGVFDLVNAVARARAEVPAMRLTMCGSGPDLERLRAHPGTREGWLEVPGAVPHERVQEEMHRAWTVVVPSWHSYPEGLPLVITEALLARTPVVLSDHPIFTRYYRRDEDVRMFAAGDPADLARELARLARDSAGYEALSLATQAAWERTQVETKFHHLLERLAREWSLRGRRTAC